MRSGDWFQVRRVGLPRALAAVGIGCALLGVAGRGARAQRMETPAQIARYEQRVWAQKVVLDVEGDTIDSLLTQLRQQVMVHIRSKEELDREPVSAFAANCTFGDVRDAMAELFHFRLTAKLSFESFLYFLSEDPAARRAALAPEPAKKTGKSVTPIRQEMSPPAVAAGADPELLKPIAIPADIRPIRDTDLILPAIQKRLAKATGIRILSDYAPRTQQCLGKKSADPFLHSLNGLPLRTALDKIAARFGYTWRKSGNWYLFRSRNWKAERRARVAAAQAREESDDAPGRGLPR